MEKAGRCREIELKKGQWSQEEDEILVSYIQRYGHGNWRALPKQAGLARCGKSCRLRWLNYLRPDIKRGNFTKAEEDSIIALHEELGNRWSAIAAKLPGRTDNEIKNVWHTHLKKRAAPGPASSERKKSRRSNVSGAAESAEQSSSEVSSTIGNASSETEETWFNDESFIPCKDFHGNIDSRNLFPTHGASPAIDEDMEFWRSVFMGEEGGDLMIF